MDILYQFILIFFFIFLNGFFVISEFSLVSSRRSKIEALANKGNKPAQLVLKAYNSLATYISATQFGITLASLALGWLGEPALANIFSILLEPHLPMQILFLSSHIVALTVAFIVITFLQIVFGELAPKTTALQKPEELAIVIIIPLMIFTAIFKPFIALLSIAAGGLLGIFGLSQHIKRSVYTEEEIKIILSQSAKGGEIDQEEVDIINRVFRIGDLPIARIMVPKKDVIAFPSDAGVWKVAKQITEKNLHTRFPIYKDTMDSVIGYTAVTDIYVYSKTLSEDMPIGKTELLRKTIFIPEGKRIDDVLTFMKLEGVHLAIVVNENKKMVGIVSIEDIIESLVGEIREH